MKPHSVYLLMQMQLIKLFRQTRSKPQKPCVNNMLFLSVGNFLVSDFELSGKLDKFTVYMLFAGWSRYKRLESLFPVTECSCRKVFLYLAFQPPALFRGNMHTTQTIAYNLYSCTANFQPAAVCKVTNEYCHLDKHLLALLLQSYTVVQCFILQFFVC